MILLPSPGNAGDNQKGAGESSSNLKKGKEFLERERYGEALEPLRLAYDELPVMRDYTLFFMARTYNRMGKFEDSTGSIQELLKTYPDSPLKKRARALQFNNIISTRENEPREKVFTESGGREPLLTQSGDAALRHLESYLSDYPEDAEMAFFMAQMLKRMGKIDRAKRLFVRIYTGTSAYAERAYQELRPPDLTPEDMLTKASNLIKAFEYKKAEAILRTTLLTADGQTKEEVVRKLGLAYFRQKKYREAGDAYLKAGDLYNSARSLYRAGAMDEFNKIVSRLVSMEDKRAGSLMIAYATKTRREGRAEDALSMFRNVRKRYPSLAEEALWGIGWTYYRTRDYRNALNTFTELHDQYPDSRYFYWKQRSEEHEVDSAQSLPEGQGRMKGSKNDIYRFFIQMRESVELSRGILQPGALTTNQERASQSNVQPPPDVLPSLDRFTILTELGMKEDAVAELVRLSNRVSRPDAILYLCRTLQEAGAYKRSIGLVSKLSEEMGSKWGNGVNINDILYPLAFWPTVSEISQRYTIDPLILLSVIREESRFDPFAQSIAGALGLMQIMPHTAFTLDKKLKIDISRNAEIYDIRNNITIGAYYLNSLLKEFNSLPEALAAYNAGHDKVREWLRDGNYTSFDEFIEDIPYDETRNYVKRVLMTYATYLKMAGRE
jgi:soluble lytic murein transglycosylase